MGGGTRREKKIVRDLGGRSVAPWEAGQRDRGTRLGLAGRGREIFAVRRESRKASVEPRVKARGRCAPQRGRGSAKARGPGCGPNVRCRISSCHVPLRGCVGGRRRWIVLAAEAFRATSGGLDQPELGRGRLRGPRYANGAKRRLHEWRGGAQKRGAVAPRGQRLCWAVGNERGGARGGCAGSQGRLGITAGRAGVSPARNQTSTGRTGRANRLGRANRGDRIVGGKTPRDGWFLSATPAEARRGHGRGSRRCGTGAG